MTAYWQRLRERGTRKPRLPGDFAVALLVLLVALLSSACLTTSSSFGFRVLEVNDKLKGEPNTSGLPLRNGQVILTESPDATSFMFMLLPAQFHEFTHAGIVAIEDGAPVVYEVSGAIRTFPLHARVLDNIAGEVHRLDLFEYVGANLHAEIYDVEPGSDGSKIVAFAREQYLNGVPFDPYFRFEDHSALYCTELVELAWRAGGAKPHPLGPVNPQPSLQKGLEWLDVLPNQSLPASLYRNDDRFVAAIGQFASRTAAYAYFAAKEEIYRRFRRPDQRLGFLFTLAGTGKIGLRPDVAAFARRAPDLFAGETAVAYNDPVVRAKVRALADEMWGPYDDGTTSSK